MKYHTMTNRRKFIKTTALAAAGTTISSLNLNMNNLSDNMKTNPVKYTGNSKDSLLNPSSGKLSQGGWCWDGQSINGQWKLSIFGAGEGTRWFGLERCCFMFHPNSPLAMEKLADMKEVICDISKWDYYKADCAGYSGLSYPVAMKADVSIERKKHEALNLSQLSKDYPIIRGAFDDDLIQIIKRDHISPEQYGSVHLELKKLNPDLKHWIVIYAHELNRSELLPYKDTFDIVTLWVWSSKDLVNLERYIDQCYQIFPDKAVYIGCYLRDFTLLDGVPINLLKRQWEIVARSYYEGIIKGYHILGGFLIDLHPEQARWIRDFIRDN